MIKFISGLAARRNWLLVPLFFVVMAVNAEAMPGKSDPTAVRPASISEDMASIYGVWKGGGTASWAIYGTMTLTPTRISWKPASNNPKCSTGYRVQSEAPGFYFKDKFGDKYITTLDKNQKYRTFLLKLDPKKCTQGTMYFRFIIDEHLPGYLDYIEYRNEVMEKSGSGHFHFITPLKDKK